MPRPSTLLRNLLLIALCLAPTPLASGQGIANPLNLLDTSPPVTRSDLRIIDSILGLTPAQRELTGDLFDEYFEVYRQRAAAMEARIVDLVDEAMIRRDFDTGLNATRLATSWSDTRETIRNDFYEDLRLLLDQQQIGLWHKVERELRRVDLIGNGRIAGESIDLIRLIDANAPGWTDNPELVALLDRYADRLDSALQARERQLDPERVDEYRNMVIDDPHRAKEIYDDVLPTRLRVRDINRQTLAEALRLLPEDKARLVEVTFFDEALQGIAPRSPIEARIMAAATLPTLDSQQREHISAVLQDYQSKRHRQSKQLFEVAAKIQEEWLPDTLGMSLARVRFEAETGEKIDPGGGSLSNPTELTEALTDRLEVDRDAWQQISAVLTPQQRAQMPRPDGNFLWFSSILSHGL